jgi:protein arginine N-methyltransferase 1
VENPDVQSQITWSISRPELGHGLGLWFDADLAPGIGFSNAPGETAHIYGRMFFPWLESITLAPGDTVTVSLYADLVGDDYLWRWETRAQDQGRPLKADFRQSSFFGDPLSLDRLQQMAAGHVPELSQDGRVDSFILPLMQGALSLGLEDFKLTDRGGFGDITAITANSGFLFKKHYLNKDYNFCGNNCHNRSSEKKPG